MAKIYSVPTQVKVPVLDWNKIDDYDKECENFKKELKEFLIKRKNGKNVGEVIQFQVADGYAEYMVASTNPPELIHLPLMDGYQFQYAHLMTAKEIQKQIDNDKRMKEFFNSNHES